MGSGFGMQAAQPQPKASSPLLWILLGGGIFAFLGIAGVVGFLVVASSSAAPTPVATSDDDGGANVNLENKDDDAGAGPGKPKPKPTSASAPTTTAIGGIAPTSTSTTTTSTSSKPPFPRSRASSEVDRVIAGAQSCHRTGDPTGTGSIRVDFEPDGRVGTLTRAPFGTTVTGSCISARMRAINIGPFQGTRAESIEATFIIRDTSPPPTSTPTPPPPTVTPPVPTKPPIFKGDAGR